MVTMLSKIYTKLFRDSLASQATNHFEIRGYETQTHEIRDGCFVIEGRRSELGVTTKSLLMVVTSSEDKVTKDHINYLINLGRKHGADELFIVCDTKATPAAQQAVTKTPITVIEKANLGDGPHDNSLRESDNPDPRSKTAKTTSPVHSKNQSTLITRRKAISLSSISLIGGGIYLFGVPDAELPDTVSGDDTLGPSDSRMISDSEANQKSKFVDGIIEHNRWLQGGRFENDPMIHPDSHLIEKDQEDLHQNGVVKATDFDILSVDEQTRSATIRVTGHPPDPDGPVNNWDSKDEEITEVYRLRGMPDLQTGSFGLYEYIDINE